MIQKLLTIKKWKDVLALSCDYLGCFNLTWLFILKIILIFLFFYFNTKIFSISEVFFLILEQICCIIFDIF